MKKIPQKPRNKPYIGLREEVAWIPKFKKLLHILPKHENFYYKNILISTVITIKDRRTGEVRVV